MAPKTMPKVAELDVATAAEAREEAWLGSKTTPAKKPEVTMRAAVRARAEGHCCDLSVRTLVSSKRSGDVHGGREL